MMKQHSTQQPAAVAPGRARLLNSGQAERLRLQVLADQRAALEKAKGSTPPNANRARDRAPARSHYSYPEPIGDDGSPSGE